MEALSEGVIKLIKNNKRVVVDTQGVVAAAITFLPYVKIYAPMGVKRENILCSITHHQTNGL